MAWGLASWMILARCVQIFLAAAGGAMNGFLVAYIYIKHLGTPQIMVILEWLVCILLVYTVLVLVIQHTGNRSQRTKCLGAFIALDVLFLGTSIAITTIQAAAGVPCNCGGLAKASPDWTKTEYDTSVFSNESDGRKGYLDKWCTLERAFYVTAVFLILSYTVTILLQVLRICEGHYLGRRSSPASASQRRLADLEQKLLDRNGTGAFSSVSATSPVTTGTTTTAAGKAPQLPTTRRVGSPILITSPIAMGGGGGGGGGAVAARDSQHSLRSLPSQQQQYQSPASPRRGSGPPSPYGPGAMAAGGAGGRVGGEGWNDPGVGSSGGAGRRRSSGAAGPSVGAAAVPSLVAPSTTGSIPIIFVDGDRHHVAQYPRHGRYDEEEDDDDEEAGAAMIADGSRGGGAGGGALNHRLLYRQQQQPPPSPHGMQHHRSHHGLGLHGMGGGSTSPTPSATTSMPLLPPYSPGVSPMMGGHADESNEMRLSDYVKGETRAQGMKDRGGF